MWPLANSAATRMAFLIALELDRPWQMMQTPRTPSSGRAAELGVVDALLEFGECRARQHIADLPGDGGPQRFLQHVLDDVHQTLADLQRDVADEAVADDDVGLAGVDVPALDVADEIRCAAISAGE